MTAQMSPADDRMPVGLLTIMCVFLGLTLTGMHGLATLLPDFIARWSLSKTEAGWLMGMSFLTYCSVVPLLTLTDRIDSRYIVLGGTLVNAVGYAGFGLWADDFWSGLIYRGLQGIGFAGTYMPGIRLISDRCRGKGRARATSVYVSSFAFTSGLSVIIAAQIDAEFGWRMAFIVPGVVNLAGFAIILFGTRFTVPEASPAGPRRFRELFDFRPVFRNRRALGYMAAGATHMIELIGLRSWTVAFLTFVVATRTDLSVQWDLPLIAMALIMIGVPSSTIGGEFGARFGLGRAAGVAMLMSAATAVLVGFSAAWPFWLFVFLLLAHNIFVLADSGALNAGLVGSADPSFRGATMALFALGNALGGFCGPVMFGVVLDNFGAGETLLGWGLGFASLGLAAAIGGLAVLQLSGRRTDDMS